MSLRHSLERSAQYDAEYGRSLSSHLPMALTALARLGADGLRLAAFAEHYASRLRPAPPVEPWPGGEAWQSRFGDPHAWPAYRSLFGDWIDHEGAPAVLAQALPALMRGVGAAAFHAQIRSAYAIDSGHAHELASALAYWACRWFSLGAAPTQGRERDPAAVLARLHCAKPQRPLIAERMALVAEPAAFARVAAGLRIDPDTTLEQLATLAARLYAASANFTVLHLLTSAHAMRVLLPCIEPDAAAEALGHYWLAYAAGHAASGLSDTAGSTLPGVLLSCPEPAASRQAPRAAKWLRRGSGGQENLGAARRFLVKPWPDLVARALASDDEHLIKLIDSCREQERAYGGTVWREAASRAVADG